MNSSNGTDATWEDNWLFKKRKLKTENQSIAMLVPSPTEEIKALIGDKNADETSDLSENSDSEDDAEGQKVKVFTNTLLIEAKAPSQEVSIITFQASESDSLKSMQSLTSFDTDNPAFITEAKNNRLLIDDDRDAFGKPSSTGPSQKIDEKSLTELSVDVEQATDEEVTFDSIISPTQVRNHRRSIEEQFEQLVMDDNNNNSNADITISEIYKETQP